MAIPDDTLVLTIRLPLPLVDRLDAVVSDRKKKAPSHLSRNTVVAQMLEREIAKAERER